MVSADPFHIEFIPLWKPVALIKLLAETGIPHFIWKQQYLNELSKIDPHKKYTPAELKEALGYDFASKCAKEYGMNFNGRALNLIRKFKEKEVFKKFLSGSPCENLSRSSHFHVDFNGYYIAPGCTGMGVLLEDIGKVIDPVKYPVFSRLATRGLQGLYDYAEENGFRPDSGYVSKCDFCFSMRRFLINNVPSKDLTPTEFYRGDY